jgi:hypothetical protein
MVYVLMALEAMSGGLKWLIPLEGWGHLNSCELLARGGALGFSESRSVLGRGWGLN